MSHKALQSGGNSSEAEDKVVRLREKLGDNDMHVLQSLFKNARISQTEIGKTWGIERSTVKKIMDRLEGKSKKRPEAKVIIGYEPILKYALLEEAITAFVFVEFSPAVGLEKERSQVDVAKEISELKEVKEVYIISGQYDLLVKIRVSSLSEISTVVTEQLRKIKGVWKTITMDVLSVQKDKPWMVAGITELQ